MKTLHSMSYFFAIGACFLSVACATHQQVEFESPGAQVPSLYSTKIESVDLSIFQTDFDYCSYVARQSEPRYLGGVLRLQIEIGESGDIEEMKTLSSFQGAAEILNCLERRAKLWSFEQKNWNSVQVWTWNFRVNP